MNPSVATPMAAQDSGEYSKSTCSCQPSADSVPKCVGQVMKFVEVC
jgi:hypothetical protein